MAGWVRLDRCRADPSERADAVLELPPRHAVILVGRYFAGLGCERALMNVSAGARMMSLARRPNY